MNGPKVDLDHEPVWRDIASDAEWREYQGLSLTLFTAERYVSHIRRKRWLFTKRMFARQYALSMSAADMRRRA